MPRRISLPGADELFRPTSEARQESPSVPPPTVEPAEPLQPRVPDPPPAGAGQPRAEAEGDARRSSGRVKHDEKMTVYVTADELIDLEHARLTLRRDTGIAVDRGRLVREAIAIALADIEARGPQADIVRRLTHP